VLYVWLVEQQFVITHRYTGDSKELRFTGDRQNLILQETENKLSFAGDKELNFAGDNLILQETKFFRRQKELNFAGDSKNFAGDRQTT